ncbi:MAG: FHA domain-containing protein [Acidobacteriota bacterium]|nr:FHA domain-containing protein [Acidobacteriota bacterium]
MSHGIRFVSGINEGVGIPIREGQEITLGRARNNDVILPYDGWVSGKHAAVKRQGGKFFLKDLRSTNGTFLGSERIPFHTYRPLKGLFVVGSTIFETTDHCNNQFDGPAPLNTAYRGKAADPELMAALEKEALGKPIINSVLVFLALASVYGKELEPFFKRLKMEIDLNRVRLRLEKSRLFRGSEAWMNRFLGLPAQLPEDSVSFITPLARSALIGQDPPLMKLRRLLEGDYNLVFPILHHEETRGRWIPIFDALTAPPKPKKKKAAAPKAGARRAEPEEKEVPAYLAPLLALDEFWNDLGENLADGVTAVLTGDTGCGKTATLRLALLDKARIGLPEILSGPVNFFDPKTFFYLQSPQLAGDYLETILQSIHGGCLTVIDHLDVLLEHLSIRGNGDRELLRAVANTHTPLILVLDRESLSRYERQFGNHEVFDFRQYLRGILGRIHNAMLDEFEHQMEAILAEDAKLFFMRRVVAGERYNLRTQWEFISLCLRRCKQIDYGLGRLEAKTASIGGIGEAIFHEVFENWLNRPAPVGTDSIAFESLAQLPEPEPEPPPASEADAAILDQIEELFYNYAQHIFNMTLRYSDQTTRLNKQGRLTREQKLDELKEHLVHMVGAFQAVFPAWFEEWWMKIDPEVIQAEIGASPKALWEAYKNRTQHIDTSLAQDQFHKTAARIFLETIQSAKQR